MVGRWAVAGYPAGARAGTYGPALRGSRRHADGAAPAAIAHDASDAGGPAG